MAFAWQGRQMFVWLLIDPDLTETETLTAIPTGAEFNPLGYTHLGSAISDTLVWHLFRKSDS